MAVDISICAQASNPRSRRDNREAILRTGCALFARHGLAGVTFDDVGRETGLTRRTIYNHFANIDDLFLAAIQSALRRLAQQLPSAPPAEQTLVPALDHFVRDLLCLFTNSHFVEVHLVLVRHGTDHPALRRSFEQQLLGPLRRAYPLGDEVTDIAGETVMAVLGLAETARLLGHAGEEAVRHALPIARMIAHTLVQSRRTGFRQAA